MNKAQKMKHISSFDTRVNFDHVYEMLYSFVFTQHQAQFPKYQVLKQSIQAHLVQF